MKQYFLVESRNGGSKIVAKPMGKVPNIEGMFSRSISYINKAELYKAKGILKNRCVHCNGLVKTTWSDPVLVKRLIDNNHCFNCDFWLRKPVELPDSFRINGYHYCNWSEYDKDGNLKGSHNMNVTMLETDEVIKVDRLTHQGEIPKRWRTLLPDNAIKETVYKQYKL